jgi:tetratricopeptide (TPR) repeat protein
MTENDFELGLQAGKRGDTQGAVAYLSKYVLENPTSEEGWLWLGEYLTEAEKRKYCYERVLKINLGNQHARRRLTEVMQQVSPLSNPIEREKPQPSPADNNIQAQAKGKENKKNNFILIAVLGLLIGIVVCGAPLVFLLLKSPVVPQIAAPTPSRTYTIPPKQTNTPTLTQTPSMTPSPMATLDLSAMANPLISEAEMFNIQGQYAEAVHILDQAIDYAPNSDKAYYLRATSYYKLHENQRSLTENRDYIYSGLSDIDMAISIEPNIGDYYMLRQSLLVALTGIMEYRADRTRLSILSAENALMGLNLGGTLEEYPDRIYVVDLLYAEKCEEALELIHDLIEQTPLEDKSITGLYHIESIGHICLGNTGKAIAMVEKSMSNPLGTDYKKFLLARYLYQDGQGKKALKILNELIEASPHYDGERYYLRAAIHYELGERELAEQDLYTGAGNTWGHAALYSYVLGKMALEDGRTQEGIELLQNADITLEVLYNPLRKNIQSELKELGAEPLESQPSIMLEATSIPTILPRPTYRPLETPATTAPENIVNWTPMPTANFPAGIYNPIIFDSGTGTGEITLKLSDYPVFRLQPTESQKVKIVKNVFINLQSFTETEKPALQISLYSPYNNGWKFLDPVWGENPVDYPEDLVYPTGDMFIAIRNFGSNPVTIDNLTITIIFEAEDGSILKIGPG